MDTLTHVAVGACMGEVIAGRQIGKKAIWWGVVAHSIPDVDFLAAGFLDTTENLLAHRGITHSLLMGTVAACLLTWLAQKWHGRESLSVRYWLFFMLSCVWMHELMDGFNNYGIGWLEPFNHDRFSLNAIYIVDPLFSIFPIIIFLCLVLFRQSWKKQTVAKWGLLWVFAYLIFSIIMKWTIDSQVKHDLSLAKIPSEKYLSTPAPFQNFLWFIAAGNDSGFYTGYKSVFDKQLIRWKFSPRNDALIQPFAHRADIKRLKKFSNGFYTLSSAHDSLIWNDLRFGQVIGWQNPQEGFAFHYYVQYPDENKLVVQRGRFEKLGQVNLLDYLKRIFGKQ